MIDPDVVVAAEGEDLGAVRLVGELRLELEGEVVVVVRPDPPELPNNS